MDDPRTGTGMGAGDRRLDDLPAHEDDADVAAQGGGGLMDEGMTAEVRGTGEWTGNAQGLDDEATRLSPGDGARADDVPTTSADATPGIHDFTQTVDEARDH